jgi:tetratricopeptide (TPR) repeat protein
MRALTSIRHTIKFLPGLLAVSSLVCIPTAAISSPATLNDTTKQAIELFKQGKEVDAQQIALKAIGEHPDDWYAHSVLSYIDWRRGQVMPALDEAQRAGQLAPDEGTVFTNLGLFNETLCRYEQSIKYFDWARRKLPDNFVPWIGLARSFSMGSDWKDATSVLTYMAAQKGKSYEWYRQVGQASLDINVPGLAVTALKKAASLATTSEQRSDCAINTLLAVLRNNEEQHGRCLAESVISKYDPQSPEIYIRAASVITPLNQPNVGAHFLQLASKHLKGAPNSDVFFKIGRVYEQKAIEAALDKNVNRKWLINASTAYRQAITLDPEKSSYHRALAGVLDRQSNSSEMLKELTKAAALDKDDKLAPYFLSEKQGYKSSLSEVKFRIEGLCSCKISSLKPAFEKVNGVVTAYVNASLPVSGTIIIDRSLTPIDQAFNQTLKNLFGDSTLINPVNFVAYSCQPVEHCC